jgi:hypothetical protein
VHATKLQTCIVDSKKQASRGLKKIIDDTREWFMNKQSKINQNKNENTHTFQYQGE